MSTDPGPNPDEASQEPQAGSSSTTEGPDRNLAVYLAGGALNQLRFHVIHAWLQCDSEHAQQLQNAFDELGVLVGQIGPDCQTEDLLREMVRQLAAAWRQAFLSENHCESVYRAEQEICSRAAAEDLASLQREFFWQLTCWWTDAIKALQSQLDGVLDERAQQLLRLGMHIDQGLRPWPLGELLCTGSSTEQSPPSVASDSVAPSLLGEMTSTCATRDDASVNWFSRDAVCAFIPSEPWFADLRQQWRRLGLGVDQLPPDARERPDHHEGMLQIVEQLDGFVRRALTPPMQSVEGDADQDERDQYDDDEGEDTDYAEARAADDDSLDEIDDADDVSSTQSDMPDAETYAGGRLKISVDSLMVVLDGEPIRIDTRSQALFFRAVASSPGWISSTDIQSDECELDGTRMDRLKNTLDPRLQEIIESKPGSGYRLRL